MNNCKRILWINDKADFTGGCESYIYHTAAGLKKHGFENILLYDVEGWTEPSYTLSFAESYPNVVLSRQIEEIKPDIIYVHRLSGYHKIKELINCGIPSVRFFHDHKLFCLREHKYKTLTHATCRKATGFRCYPCLGFINKGSGFPGIKLASLHKLKKEQDINKKLDGFVVASDYMRNHMVLHGFDKEKITVNPLFSWQTPAEDQKPVNRGYFLFAGQLLRGKGVDLAIDALQELPQEAMLYIAGSGKQENEFMNLTKKLGLQDRVKFLGFMKKNELEKLYRECFCLIMPSRVPETFGLSGLEAMSFAKPVIASDVGGISQWLEDGKTGILFDVEKKGTLGSAMLKLWKNPELAARMGNNGLTQYQAKYQPENHIDKLAEYFNEIISGGKYVTKS